MSRSAKSLSKLPTSTSSSSSRTPPPPPPPPLQPVPPPPSTAFLCPISSLLMSGPILVPSGHSVDLPCIQACKHLNFSPPHLNLNQDFLPIPNINLRKAIREYCQNSGYPLPTPISSDSALHFVRQLILTPNPSPPPPLPPFSYDPVAEQSILVNLQEHSPLSAKESTLSTLIQTPYFSPRTMAAVIPILSYPQSNEQSHATHLIMILSATPANRTHVLLCGAVTPLITVASDDHHRSGQMAVRALYRLSMEESNHLAIGALGAIPTLLDQLCGYYLMPNVQVEAVMALKNLLSCQQNLEVLLDNGGVGKLMSAVENKLTMEVKKLLLVLIQDVVQTKKGAEELMDGGGVKFLFMWVKLKEGVGFSSLMVMSVLCNGESSERFREVARAEGGVEVLMEEREDWEEHERGIARELVSALIRESSSDEIEGK